MYSLSYKHRRLGDSVEGPCYEDLESVSLRFDLMLTSEHDTEATVSRVISVDTLDLGMTTGGHQDRSGDSDQVGDTEMFFTWSKYFSTRLTLVMTSVWL